MTVDLHMHSTASDGTDDPAALARLAREAGLTAIALTDHDTTAGNAVCAAACAAAGVTFIPGIELSAERGKERGAMHILGYFVGESAMLSEVMADQLQARTSRNPQIIAMLNSLGVDITIDEVQAEADGTIGRPHIAAVLVRKGYCRSIQDAFNRYLGYGAAAYVRKDRLPPGRAIEAIHDAGGLAVLAHPIQLKAADEDELEHTIATLAKQGLDGLEVWHSDHRPSDVQHYRRLADRFDLLTTGGSDYHGRRKTIALGSADVPEGVIDAMRQRLTALR
jgi:predicted metal-dependent phosphoesterase TrpH